MAISLWGVCTRGLRAGDRLSWARGCAGKGVLFSRRKLTAFLWSLPTAKLLLAVLISVLINAE